MLIVNFSARAMPRDVIAATSRRPVMATRITKRYGGDTG